MDIDLLADVTSMPLRRDVQGMRQLVSELQAGDSIRAVFKSLRYGPFAVEGMVRSSEAGQLMVADQFIGTPSLSAATPSRVENDLQRLRRLPASESTSVAAALADDSLDVSDIKHGDLVRVWFTTPTHGEFAITGVATHGDDRFMLVGNWIVVDGQERAPRVSFIETVVRAADHDLHVPRRAGSLTPADEAS